MQNGIDLESLLTLLSKGVEAGVMNDRRNEKRLYKDVSELLSSYEFDYNKAKPLIIKFLMTHGDYSKVPINNLKVFSDLNEALRQTKRQIKTIRNVNVREERVEYLKDRYRRLRKKFDDIIFLMMSQARIDSKTNFEIMNLLALFSQAKQDTGSNGGVQTLEEPM